MSKKKVTRTYQFFLPEIFCNNCTNPIIDGFKTNECKNVKVIDAQVDITRKILKIEVEESQRDANEEKELLRKFVEQEKFVKCVDLPGDPLVQRSLQAKYAKRSMRNHIIKGVVGLVVGLVIMGLMISGVGIPLAAMIVMGCVSVGLSVFLGWESYKETWKAIKNKNVTMDTLFSLSTLASIGVSIASFFVPTLPMIFDVPLLIFGFRHIGKAIEDSAQRKLTKHSTFCERLPKRVRVRKNGRIEWCMLENIVAGDELIISHGEMIPVDGICLSDDAEITQTDINGDPWPKGIQKSAPVLQGMYLSARSNEITIRVNKPYYESRAVVQDRALAEALGADKAEIAPLEKMSSKALRYFIPIVLVLAVVIGITLGILFPPALAIQCVIAVLVSACPCVLGMIVPLGLRIGQAKANKQGAFFKDGKSLQRTSEAKKVVLDIHGTLTKGEPKVQKLERISRSMTSKEMASIIYALESASEQSAKHPVGKALIAYGKKHGVKQQKEHQVTKIDTKHHAGISATIDGDQYTIGDINKMRAAGVDVEKITDKQTDLEEHVIYLAKNNKIIARIVLADELRPDALSAVKELQKTYGKQNVHICTGANEATAHYYAKKLGIPKELVKSDCTAANKEAYIDELQKKQHKKVIFVGDAGNDAGPVGRSHVGMAVCSSGASEVTQTQARVLICKPNEATTSFHPLVAVVSAIKIAKQTVSSIKKSLLITLGYNIAAMALLTTLTAIGFAFNPAIGALLMIVQVGVVLFSMYHLKRQQMGHLKRFETQQSAHGLDNVSTLRVTKKLVATAPQNELSSKSSVTTIRQAEPIKVKKAYKTTKEATDLSHTATPLTRGPA